MIKMSKLFGMLITASALVFAGCSEDSPFQGSGNQGKVNLKLNVDAKAITPSSASRADEENSNTGSDTSYTPEITANDFTIKATSADGSWTKTWSSPTEFAADGAVPVGTINLEAYYGDLETEGCDSLYVHGSTIVNVSLNATTETSISAELKSAELSFAIADEAIRDYITINSVSIFTENSGAEPIVYPKGETRPVYLKPGTITLRLNVTKNGQNGVMNITTSDPIVLEARYHYTISLGFSETSAPGTVNLSISFNDDIEKQEIIEIDLSEDVVPVFVPLITPTGFTSNTEVVAVPGCPTKALNFNILAKDGIDNLILSTDNPEIIHLTNWPKEVDLMDQTNSKEIIDRCISCGLEAAGLWGNPSEIALVKMANVLKNATEHGQVTFTLKAIKNGKESEEVILKANLMEESLQISGIDETTVLHRGETLNYSFGLEYLGTSNVNDLKLMIHKKTGYEQITGVTATENSDGTYTLSFSLELINLYDMEKCELVLRNANGDKESNTITIPVEAALTCQPTAVDVYATYAYVKIYEHYDGAVVNPADYTSDATLYVSADGTNFNSVSGEIKEGYLYISGLTPSKTYTIRSSIGNNQSKYPTTFTTEAATQLPNTGMEEWAITDSGKNWSLFYAGTSLQSAVWGTNNPMTTSQGADLAYCRISGTIYTSDAHKGNYAALIRTVGWGSGNDAVGDLNSRVMKYGDTGLLHLGASRSSRPSDITGVAGPITTDDLNCGIEFYSRPQKLSFWYKYSPKNSSDNGQVEIWIKDEEGNILSTNTINLSKKDSFSQIELNLNYKPNSKKAAKIYVKFISTNKSDYLTKDTNNFTSPPFGNLSSGTYMGSQLWIDDIELIY